MPRATLDPTNSLERVAGMLRCLGHPLRLRLLDALAGEERCVSELQDLTGEDQASVSRQLATLRARRLVSPRRDGVNVYYRITEPRVHLVLECLAALPGERLTPRTEASSTS